MQGCYSQHRESMHASQARAVETPRVSKSVEFISPHIKGGCVCLVKPLRMEQELSVILMRIKHFDRAYM